MIDTLTENVFPLSEAHLHVPTRRGRKVHRSAAYRWATAGCRPGRAQSQARVVLGTIQVGGVLHTSKEELQRFFERLSTPRLQSSGGSESVGVRRTSKQRENAALRAERELIEAGA